ncbi:MAG: type III pantothenate kinase [Synechococcaceae cyanobacterium]|nr:type III pantothenate kinase [Synechococcaceae cyanobacterium]
MGGGGTPARWLLIGNSRWHWARPAAEGEGLALVHTPPPEPAAAELSEAGSHLLAWAAVGPLPAPLAAALPAGRRLSLSAVPLAAAPAWLGIDRALVGWQAWRRSGSAVLVADAGTVLSLTRVDRGGAFAGGRLLAGAALQWRAMAAGTAALPALEPGLEPEFLAGAKQEAVTAAEAVAAPEPWPVTTAAAMRSGVLLGLAAAVALALEETVAEEPECRLLLTGGDAAALRAPLAQCLAGRGLAERLAWRPALALEALAALAPQAVPPKAPQG